MSEDVGVVAGWFRLDWPTVILPWVPDDCTAWPKLSPTLRIENASKTLFIRHSSCTETP